MRRRYRKSVPLSRNRQFYIIGISLAYPELPKEKKRRIEALCKRVCPENWQALLRYVTTEEGATAAMIDSFIASATTIERATRDYFLEFDL